MTRFTADALSAPHTQREIDMIEQSKALTAVDLDRLQQELRELLPTGAGNRRVIQCMTDASAAISALLARAEKAEAERDEALARIVRLQAINHALMLPVPVAPDVQTVADAVAEWINRRDGDDTAEQIAVAAIEAYRRASLSPGEAGPVASWQRQHPTSGWIEVYPEDLHHYRCAGQQLRALYAHPAPTPSPAVSAGEAGAAPDWTDAARHMLETWDMWLGGGAQDLGEAAHRLLIAGSFAAQAFEDLAGGDITADGAAGGLMRAFLVALVDPGSLELDHLRACNRPTHSQAQEG